MKNRTGFAGLSQITPDLDHDAPIDTAAIDRAAEKHGFSSREPVRKLVKRPVSLEATANLNIRPSVSVYNRFVAFSVAHRLSYPEALKELMDRAQLDMDGKERQ